MYNRLANRYAKALIDASRAQDSEQSVMAEMAEITRVFSENEAIPGMIRAVGRHPVHSRTVADDLIERLKPGPVTRHFMESLIENRKMYLLPEILDAYLHEIKRRSRIVEAEVSSIRALEPDEQRRIQQSLASATGRAVEISWRIDRSILGGIRVRIGDDVFDGSLRSRLNQLHDELMKE